MYIYYIYFNISCLYVFVSFCFSRATRKHFLLVGYLINMFKLTEHSYLNIYVNLLSKLHVTFPPEQCRDMDQMNDISILNASILNASILNMSIFNASILDVFILNVSISNMCPYLMRYEDIIL